MKVATVFALLLVSANAFTAPQFATRAVGAPKKTAAPKKKAAPKKPVLAKIKASKVCVGRVRQDGLEISNSRSIAASRLGVPALWLCSFSQPFSITCLLSSENFHPKTLIGLHYAMCERFVNNNHIQN